MHCSQCGKETDGPRFCEYCGAVLEPAPAPAPLPQFERRPSAKRWIWAVGGLGIVIVLILASVTAGILISTGGLTGLAARATPTHVARPPRASVSCRT